MARIDSTVTVMGKEALDQGDGMFFKKRGSGETSPSIIPGLTQEDSDWLAQLPVKEQRRIFHKVDKRLVPMLALLYLIAHLDRANLGNAKLQGLETSLNMTNTDYNVAVAIFAIPCVLCEVPSNLLLAKFKKPSRYMGMLVVCWGTVITFTGLVQSFGALVATRFLLGLFEAGFFPGAIWIISQWYPANKSQSRIAMFYLSSALSGAISGLLAAGISHLDGLGGQEGWRWFFIIEGVVSVSIGILCFYGLPDSSSTAGWLTVDEARFLNLSHISSRGVRAVVRNEASDGEKRFKWSTLWEVLTDRQLYLQALVASSNAVPNCGLKYTMPQIVHNMGFTSFRSQLLTAPPYLFGGISALVSAYFADRVTWRMPFIVGAQSLLVIAFSILFIKAGDIAAHIPLCYICLFLACIGVYPIVPGCNAWTINNLAGADKRAMGIAFMTSVSALGGLPGSFIYLEREKPSYPTGFGSSLAFAGAGIIAALGLELLYWRHNTRYAAMTEEEALELYGEAGLEKMGNKSPLFKYGL